MVKEKVVKEEPKKTKVDNPVEVVKETSKVIEKVDKVDPPKAKASPTKETPKVIEKT